MKEIKHNQDNIVFEVVLEFKQFVYLVLQDPILDLAHSIVKLILDYVVFNLISSEQYDFLGRQLASDFPDSKNLSKIFNSIDILNLADLDLNISYRSLTLLIELLCKYTSISAFIFKNTRLLNRDGNQIIYIINEVLEKSPRALLSLYLSASKPDPLAPGAELLLLNTLERNSITSLSLINIPVRLSKLLSTVSNNLSISSLTVDNASIELQLMSEKVTQMPKPESFKKIFEKIVLCKSLSFISIPRVTCFYEYMFYELAMEKFNNIIEAHQDDISQILHQRIRQVFNENKLTPIFPKNTLKLILNYISYNRKPALSTPALLRKNLYPQPQQTCDPHKSNLLHKLKFKEKKSNHKKLAQLLKQSIKSNNIFLIS